MDEDRKKIINYIIYFLSLIIIFLISGYYIKIENIILLSVFFPVVFIPILLLAAYKGLYVNIKQLLYFAAILSSLMFFISIVNLRKSDLINSTSIGSTYLLIILFSFLISFFIHMFSYSMISFFGIRIDDKIIENIKTISCTIEDNADDIQNLVEFFLTEFLRFEYVGKSIRMEAHIFEGIDNKTTLVRYHSENQNPTTLSVSYIMFYDNQDGVKVFKHKTINSFSLFLEKFLGGKNVTTPDVIKDEFNKYFSIYRPKIKKIHEFLGKSQINWRDFKNPLIVLVGVLIIAYAIFNIEKIINFISEINTDTVIKISALIFALPPSIFYLLKIFGKIK